MNKKQKQFLLDMQLGRSRKGNNPRKRTGYNIKEFYCDLVTIMHEWGTNECMEAIDYISSHKSKSFLWYKEQLFPKDWDKLHRNIPVNHGDDGSCWLRWYSLIIEYYASTINTYLKKRDEFEICFIKGEYDKAEELLASIENQIGVSLWSLDWRLALCEYSGGLEKNKEYLASICEKTCDGWTKTFADFFSFKAEKGVNNRKYVHRIENILNEMEDVKHVFIEKLFPISNYSVSDINDILSYTSIFSLIDIYNTYIKACVRVLVEEENGLLVKGVTHSLEQIVSVEDVVIRKLKYKVGLSRLALSDFDKAFLNISDRYTEGKYYEVIDLAKELLDCHCNCFELYEYLVKSHIMGNIECEFASEKNVYNEIIETLYISYLKNEDTPRAFFSLSRLLRLFSSSNLGTEFACFFADKYSIGLNKVLVLGKEFISPIINTKLICNVKDKDDDMFELFTSVKRNSATVALYSFIYKNREREGNELIDFNRKRWYTVKRDIEDKRTEVIASLIKWYKELGQNVDVYSSYQKERISTELYYLYIDEGRIIDAEELLVDETIRNNFSTLRMDLQYLMDNIGVKSKTLKENICTPIVASLFYKNDYTFIYSNVANFLSMNDASKPSDLFYREEEFGKDRLVYFLRYVCVSEVLDSMFNVFNSETDVDNERIDICTYLQTQDGIHSTDYIEEISQILQNRKINEGVKYLEDVKIEVDYENIYQSQKELFEDGYKRFCQINLLNKDYATYAVSSDKVYIFGEEKKTYSHALLAFKDLIEDYRRELAFGKFGLDLVLGTRIRHGHLLYQIRIAFESNNIAFISKSTEDRTYIPTVFFERMTQGLMLDARNSLYNLLSLFSRKVDDYIDELNREYIRIKIDDKNERGLFDFSLTMPEIFVIMETVRKYQNVNLVREAFEYYWNGVIKESLEKTKIFFSTTVQEHFINMLKDLEEEIIAYDVLGNVKTILLDSISKARTDLQNEIAVIVDWFKLPRMQAFNDYNASELIDICEEINNRVVPNYQMIQVNKVIEMTGIFKGQTFSHIIDILIILFTNAFYHSGYIDNLSRLKIDLFIIEEEDRIKMTMINNLSEYIDKDELNQTVLDMQIKLQECILSKEYYNYEGKSGYLKICKILEYNLSCGSYLEFGLCDQDKNYFVSISIPKKYILLREVYNEDYFS